MKRLTGFFLLSVLLAATAGAAPVRETPDFAWVPDEPFDFVPSNDAMPEPQAPAPRAAVPAPEPVATPEPQESEPELPTPKPSVHPDALPQEAADLGDLGAFSPAAQSLFTGPDLVAAMSRVDEKPDSVAQDAMVKNAPAEPRFSRLSRLMPPQKKFSKPTAAKSKS